MTGTARRVLGVIAMVVCLAVSTCMWCAMAAYGQEAPSSSAASKPAEDKEPVPVIAKQVLDAVSGKWTDAVTAQSGDDVEFRVAVTLGDDVADAETYALEVVDELPDGMEADPSSCRATVDGKEAKCKVAVGDGTLEASFADVKALGAKPGSVVEIAYKARIADAGAYAGLREGYVNRAYAVYPEGKTEKAEARVFCTGLVVTKYDAQTMQVLAGAEFAVRDAQGRILSHDGTWLDAYDADRCLFETGADGTATLPGLGEGSYDIVEAVAPAGYALAEARIALEIEVDEQKREISASVDHDLAELQSVDARTGTVAIGMKNEKGEPGRPTDVSKTPYQSITKKGSLPQTGDRLPMALFVGAMAVAFAAACVLLFAWRGRRGRR